MMHFKNRKICVLGNTGGGRDTWKRPEMGRIADEACEKVILTNEDPYDEDPRAIVLAMARGMRPPLIIMDRREAIRAALMSGADGRCRSHFWQRHRPVHHGSARRAAPVERCGSCPRRA